MEPPPWVEQLTPYVDKCAEALQRFSLTEVAAILETFLNTDYVDGQNLLPHYNDEIVLEPLYNHEIPSTQSLSWDNRFELMEQWMNILQIVFEHLNDGFQYRDLAKSLVIVQLFLRLSLFENCSRFKLAEEMQMQSIIYVLHMILDSRRHENLLLRRKKNSSDRKKLISTLWSFLVPSALFFGYLWYRNSG